MTPLDSLIHRLYERGVIQIASTTDDINTYSYTYMGRLTEQRVTVVPKMKKETLRKIIGSAMSGNISDIATVAMLYNVGYGLPKDRALSECWAQFATISPAQISFDDACTELKKHWRDAPDEIWPHDLTMPVARITARLNRFKLFSGKTAGATVLPRLMGVRVFLIYRQAEGCSPHLYAGYYQDSGEPILDIDALIRLGAPRYLGELRGKCIIDSYTPFGQHSMYVVVGTIAIPKPLHKAARRFGKTTRDVFKAFLEGSTARKTRESFDNTYYLEQLSEFYSRAKLLKAKRKTVKGMRRVNLNAQYTEAVQRYRRMKALVENSDPETEYANYLDTLPEKYLKLVTHELYLWENGELVAAPIPASQTPLHLSSLGFTSLRHSQLEFLGYCLNKRLDDERLKSIAEKFEEVLGFKVTGLIIQPKSKTAQLRLCRIFIK